MNGTIAWGSKYFNSYRLEVQICGLGETKRGEGSKFVMMGPILVWVFVVIVE